ncbi:fimbrial assembly protein [Planococcus antarcticus DSM 14505]|uniref:Fimbrial assembly protein n=1 Tax=Planococcus antarcticus DSM 14505 TaxID=1185653 RepID=A0ABM6D7S1_9BACL|nr:fimbrial assembly protein [Planococcus antarcticus]ANU11313.1 fimbrial assembly protein [Planococcus antarcticus DSM 14505]
MLVDINLLPQKERDRPAFLIAAISILLAAVIVWAVLAFLAGSHESEQQVLAAQSVQVATEQASIRAQLEAAQGMNEEQQLKATVDWAEGYQFDTVPLLEGLVSMLPARGFFDSFSYTGLDQAILSVQFDTAREAAYYLAQLKASELIESATLDSVAQNEMETVETEEGVVIEQETVIQETPRYIATYTLVFIDERIPTDDTAVPVEGEAVVEEPAEEVVEEPAEDVEVDVEVNTETRAPADTVEPAETAPAETGGDGQ